GPPPPPGAPVEAALGGAPRAEPLRAVERWRQRLRDARPRQGEVRVERLAVELEALAPEGPRDTGLQRGELPQVAGDAGPQHAGAALVGEGAEPCGGELQSGRPLRASP